MDTRIQISSKLTRWVGSTSKNLSTGNALKYRLVGASNNWCTGSWRVTCPLFVKVNEPNYSQSNPLCFLISIGTHILPCESLLMNKWQHMRYANWKWIVQLCKISYLHIVVIIVALRISCSVVSWTQFIPMYLNRSCTFYRSIHPCNTHYDALMHSHFCFINIYLSLSHSPQRNTVCKGTVGKFS